MTCINRGSLPTRKGSRSPKSREPFCNCHWHSGTSLSPWLFSLSGFSRIFIVFVIDFSIIWLHPLSYFSVWTDSLGIIHCNFDEREKKKKRSSSTTKQTIKKHHISSTTMKVSSLLWKAPKLYERHPVCNYYNKLSAYTCKRLELNFDSKYKEKYLNHTQSREKFLFKFFI